MNNTEHTVKPFCVKTSDFTEQQIIEIHRLAVEAGAMNREYPQDGVCGSMVGELPYLYNACNYFGVDEFGKTYFHNFTDCFDCVILTSMGAIHNHLEIKQEKPAMKSTIKLAKQQQTQNKASNKGLKILPKTSNLLEFIYAESKYTVRGVTSFEIVLEAPSLFLKYNFHRVNQNGHVQGSEKVKIFGDLEKIIFKTPSDFNKNIYKQKTVLNLKG